MPDNLRGLRLTGDGSIPAIEQVLQGIVLVSLLIAVTRKPVRDRFAKRQV